MSSMLSRFFGKPKPEPSAIPTLEKLAETLDMLEKKENLMQRKIAQEVERAREYTRLKNKRAAIQCLKRKKMYEAQAENLANHQLRIHDQMILLESAKATTEVVDALRSGAMAMKNIQKQTNIDSVDKTMDEINEQTENIKQIQQALGEPFAGADFDEDELEAELEELEAIKLEEEILQQPLPAVQVPTRPVPQAGVATGPSALSGRTRIPASSESSRTEEQELADLQAEMA